MLMARNLFIGTSQIQSQQFQAPYEYIRYYNVVIFTKQKVIFVCEDIDSLQIPLIIYIALTVCSTVRKYYSLHIMVMYVFVCVCMRAYVRRTEPFFLY